MVIPSLPSHVSHLLLTALSAPTTTQARRRGGSRGSNELPLVVNNGGLKTQSAGFQLLANSEGLENKL